MSAIFFVDGAGLGGYVAHLPDILARLHLTNAELGRALLFSALGAMTTMPLAGSLIHRFGSRWVSLGAGSILLTVLPFVMLAPSLWILCPVLYLVGASNGQTDVGMNTHAMSVQGRFPRPILSAMHGWFSVGGFAGGAGTALAARLGVSPPVHMIVASILLAGVLVAGVAAMLPSDIDKEGEGPRFALPKGAVLMLGILVLLALASEGAMWDWCAVYLRQALHAKTEIAAFGFGLASLSMAVGRFLGDSWTHRSGYRRVLRDSALLTGAGLLLAVNLASVPLSIVGFALTGLGLANLVPILFRAAATLPGLAAGSGLAAVTTLGYTAFLGGPPIVGYIADRTSLAFALGLIAFCCLAIAMNSRRAAATLDTGT
ncbi:major facilitator superfamily MFS_1 [Fimbriimonas ginsengisoli Gsoil 348]|uniref:Major facilitator superfamily MFS_1 n=1 Tax=Fimbriimonas ginsengisoli Gsoil 348 TaxID=661478 RepID=A0A068NX87_FIMGI|nr:major facilitator superfamily MFS_1 [Fimbriimonas ginsengisoli Gsoil 348]